MSPQTRREIRFGLIALALSGLLFALGIVLRGPINLADPASFIRTGGSASYVPAWIIILVGGLLQIYGFFGLYRYLTHQAHHSIAFPALVLSIAGIALFLPLAAFFGIHGPGLADLYQRGNQEALAMVEANFSSTSGRALLGVSSLASLIGLVLFAIVIWRHGRLPKWTAVLLVVSLPLLAFPLTFTTELLGAILLLIGAATIAWRGWESVPRTERSS